MNHKQAYSISVGTLMLVASMGFFMIPVIFPNVDGFIPVMMSMVSFLVAIAFYFMGLSEK